MDVVDPKYRKGDRVVVVGNYWKEGILLDGQLAEIVHSRQAKTGAIYYKVKLLLPIKYYYKDMFIAEKYLNLISENFVNLYGVWV